MKIPSGREDIAQLFSNLLKTNRLSNSYIINGENGIGKKTVMEYILALIVCSSHSVCGECASCKSLAAKTHPDVIQLKRADTKSSIGIDSVRGIMGEIYVKPIMAEYKAVIVHEAHLLTAEAQNAMLKVIEEPPEKVTFFFLCDTTATILPTIISRSVIVNLAPLGRSVLESIAKADEFELCYCQGNPGVLKRLTGDSKFTDLRDGVTDAFNTVISPDSFDVFESVAFFENNKDNREEIINIILFFLRDVLYKKFEMSEYIVNKDKINHINAFGARVSAKSCLKMMKTVTDIQKARGKNGNYTIAVTMMLLKCREEING